MIVARSTKRSLRARWWSVWSALGSSWEICLICLLFSLITSSNHSLVVSVTKAYRYIILKNTVKLAQFHNTAPGYLTLTEGFWRALSSLPVTYDYSAYRQLIQTYGTHYLYEGSLGGQYKALLKLTREALSSSSKNFCCDLFWFIKCPRLKVYANPRYNVSDLKVVTKSFYSMSFSSITARCAACFWLMLCLFKGTTDIEYQRCWRKVKRRFFRKKVKTVCEKLTKAFASSSGEWNCSLDI